MGKLELLEKRKNYLSEMSNILNRAKTHKRALLSIEDKEFNELRSKVENIDKQLNQTENNTNININNTMKNQNLFRNLVNANKGELDQKEIKTQLRKSGVDIQENEYILNVRALTPTGGENLVETQVMELDPILAEKSIFAMAGGHYVSVPAEITLPNLNRGTLNWENDGDEVTNDNFSISATKLYLNRLSGAFPMDKKMTKVVSPTLEATISDSIYKLINEKVNAKFMEQVSGATVVTGGTTSYENLVSAEGVLLGKNVSQSNLVYFYNASDLSKLKARGKRASEITEPILADNKIGGYPAFACNDVPAGKVLMIDSNAMWANIAYVGLILDPYTLASKGQDRIVVNAYGDTNISLIDYAVFAELV